MEFGNQQITERDLVWLACFIDCEGSIQLTRHHKKTPTLYHARVGASLTDAKLVERTQEILRKMGCNPHIYQYKLNNENAKPVYMIQFMRFSQIRRVLEAILPYLIVKDAQARLLLDFINRRTKNGQDSGRNRPYTVEEQTIWGKMKRLNVRGISESIRLTSHVDEDVLRPPVKAGESGGNDQAALAELQEK